MTVKLFRSSEVGAPQLGSTTSGDLLTILRACLVEGFGSRTAAGWTMPFSDLPNKIACFKSATGDTLRLDDSIHYQYASGLGFKSMSDLNTGIEQYPNADTIGDDTTYHWRLQKRYGTATQHDPWYVVASEDWFYFVQFQNSTNQNYPSGFYFGEYTPTNPAQPEAYVITGRKEIITTLATNSSYMGLYNASEWWTRRNYQNSTTPAPAWNYFSSFTWANPNPTTGHLELGTPVLRSETSPYVRLGNLSNRFEVKGGSQGSVSYRGGETFTVDGRNYIMAKYSTICYAIEYDVSVN